MKRMVELPSGEWIDVDMIESIEHDLFGGTHIYMESGRTHKVTEETPAEVMQQLKLAMRKLEI